MAHEQNSKCACSTDDNSILLGQASQVNKLANFWLTRGNMELGSLLTDFTEKLLAKRQGEETQLHAWVLAGKVLIAENRGDLPQALAHAREAEALSLRLHGEKHPALAIARGNVGEVLAKIGEAPEEARRYLSQAIFVLSDKASVSKEYSRDYLVNAVASFAQVLQTLPPRPPKDKDADGSK